jgi:predicted nucleic acid-binding Zn ribbon protein
MDSELNRQPKPIMSFFQDIIRELNIEDEYTQQLIEDKWKEIAGEAIAKQCTIRKFEHGTLSIDTTSSTWRAELFLRRHQIKNDLNKAIGKDIIKEIYLR